MKFQFPPVKNIEHEFNLGGNETIGWPWSLKDVEDSYILYIVERSRNLEVAAIILGIARKTLYNRLRGLNYKFRKYNKKVK